jgi:hypothetical protein
MKKPKNTRNGRPRIYLAPGTNVFTRKSAHGLISEILEISPWAYFRENTVINLIFSLNHIKDNKLYFIAIDLFVLRI